jgi:hypothetical protein
LKKTTFVIFLLGLLAFPNICMAALPFQSITPVEPSDNFGWEKLPQDAASKIQQNLHKAMCKFEKLESGTVVAKLNLVRKDLTEWYVNHGDSLEHGLVINKKLAGTGLLNFSFTTSGNLAPQQNGKDISFVGDKTINYGGIKAWDVAGKQLVCSMSVDQGQLIWAVDDSKAKYPVTVDPTISFVKKITASDAEEDDYFGYSVSISDDIAIVTAPCEDTKGRGSGVAYIFYKDKDGENSWGEVKKNYGFGRRRR